MIKKKAINFKEKEENSMNAYAIRPTMPYVTTKQLTSTPASEINKQISKFIDSHDFSFDVNKNTGDLKVGIKTKKNEHC